MNTSANPLYEQWQLTLPSMPAPSVLYALAPIGIGSPHVESMTSYIARLAEAHCVFPGVLMRHLIVPFAKSHLTGEGSSTTLHLRDGESTGALNAHQQTAVNTVHILESLTKQRRLHLLTMVTWAEVFPLTSLIRTKQAWCPLCLEEWKAAGQVIYEPLLWTMQAVKICSQHDCLLETQCFMCRKTSPWLAWRSHPGYCPYCQRWLGMSAVVQEKNEREMNWLHWSADQVGMLLASAPLLTKFPARACINERLGSLLEQISQGRKMTFARLVGLSPKLVGNWFYHQQIPGVENLLRVCFAVNISLRDLFMEKQITCSLRSEETRDLWSSHHRQVPRGFWKSSQVREKLEALAKNEEVPPPSLKAVARQLGCSDPHSLQLYHPVPSQMISDRYAAYMDAKKLATEQQHCKDVQNAVRQLIEQNIPPTGRNVALVLSKPGILRSSVMREARRAAIREGQIMGNQSKEIPEKAKSVV